MLLILFFGDSLTAGYGLKDPLRESLPARISDKIAAENWNFQVINSGLSGDTSTTGLNRIDAALNHEIDIFVLELGANDLLRGHQAHILKANMQQILTKVKTKYPKADILILGMRLPAWIPENRAPGYRTIYQELAQKNNCELVPFLLEGVEGKKHLNMFDGVHPLAAGYQIIADNIWPKLKSMIAKHSAVKTL